MLVFIKDRILLFVVLAAFILLKIPHLHYAYYWDESWPYAEAIDKLYHHGISLMPNAIDSDISRGHPLFFHVLAVLWRHIFGNSHVSMHSFALAVSVVFLILIYEAGLRLFGKRTAIITLLLTATCEMFFIQSSMVLFEVLVALLCFLSLVCYVKDKYVLTAVSLTMLFYTKESGMVLGAVLGIDAATGFFNTQTLLRQRWYKVLSIAMPCVAIGGYFLLQKKLQGWYIFPFYAEQVPHRWKDFWYNFRMNSLWTTFYFQYKYYLFFLLLILAIITTVKKKKVKYLAALPPAICIYCLVDDQRSNGFLPPVPAFIIFLLTALLFLYTYSRLYTVAYQRKFIFLAGMFVLLFFCFSAMNFFTPRYMLAAIIPVFFITAAAADKLMNLSYRWLFIPVLVLIIAVSSFNFIVDEGIGDCDLGAFDGLNIHQGVVDYFEVHTRPATHICAISLEGLHLKLPATGFLHTDQPFIHITGDVYDSTQYVVADNIELPGWYKTFKNDKSFVLADSIKSGSAWAEIYKRK